MFAIEHYSLVEAQRWAKKNSPCVNDWKKIADSSVQANTDEPQTEANHRKKEERLRIVYIRNRLVVDHDNYSA
jgi:predicted O-linked N-acetylglucosamine transferase (SPINDLY family)